MTATTTTFHNSKAPCGQTVDGEHFQEQDEECMITDQWQFACGCRIIVHEFHDGSVQRKVIHHKGHLLNDELVAEHRP
jgi:hypothetical protein